MLTNSCVTVYRSTDGGEYLRLGTYPAWSYRQSRIKSESGGRYSRDVFDVRIPSDCGANVAVGDAIAFGKYAAQTAELEKCRLVSAVTENNFGTCPHLHIKAENQYR